MNLAIIDMGTSTFHLLLVKVANETFEIFHKEKIAAKIGANGISEGYINDDAIERCLSALKSFKKQIDAAHIHKVHAFATSAIRNAKNQQFLIQKIKEEVGIEPRVISGMEEAFYIHYGVCRALNMDTDIGLIMDIGGGSIEFIISQGFEPIWMKSFEIGGQRMMEKFHENDPITTPEISAIESYLEINLQPLFEACDLYKPKTLIGSSGTFETLSEIYQRKINKYTQQEETELPISQNGMLQIFQEIIAKNKQERLLIPGMIELRVDMIVVASILIQFILKRTGLETTRISSYALKEGALLQTIKPHTIKIKPHFKNIDI
ncbi:MAG: exopolyphosphatase [Flammeovirgaceae bacterium]|nr:exopolyphosphatase [Flammeovirgaceae bacterium]|tara:strand:+ start:5736 stop:6698 length:963 start_codon:yes stop_codon:yes gene_type:complete